MNATENATENATDKPSPAAKPSSALSIALAWLVVIVPAAWGVYNTALKAANLFK